MEVTKVRLPAELVERLDGMAVEWDRTRSYLIRKAVEEFAARNPAGEAPDRWRTAGSKEGVA